MDDEYLDRPQSASPNSCCPVPFLSTSPSPGRAPANADSIFSYDPKLLHHGQAVLYTPGVPSLSEAMERDRHLETKVADEEEGGSGGMQFCHEWETLKCWKSSATSCSVCGIMCNPLLTSRLALTGLLAVLLIVMTVLTWVFTSTNVQHSVRSVAAEFRHEMLLRTEDIVDATLQGNNASAVSLARFLSSLSQGNQSSFLGLEDQVRPVLFLVFSVLGKKAQVTFFGKSGLFLSYLAGPSGISLLYANLSYLSPVSSDADISHVMEIPWKEGENLMVSRPWYKWYRQNVDENTGFPVGEAVSLTPFPYWDTEPVKSSLHGQYGATSWGRSLDDSREVLFSFLSSVQQSPSADPFGAISIGVPFANLDSLFDQFDLQGGAIYLAMADGRLVAQTGVSFPPYYNDNATTQVLPFATQSNNSIVAAAADYLTPHLPYILALRNESFTTTNAHLQGIRYMIDSAPLHLSGATLVCVVIIPYKSIWGLTEKWSHTTLAVLVALATCMGLVGCSFVILLTKGVSNEMRLRAALIQQLEETKSAETKSSHKSLVFANMSHDLRTPLAAILGLLDLCLSDASECSELETNLLQMKSCATNLLGILNSILDMSKIEAGKLLLQESEFDLVSALEEVVDTFSVVGLKTGVEVALDLSDGSVEKASCVVGDVGRVKQIMANLLSNGVKFTLEGHVILRAWVKPLGISTMRPQFNYRGRLLSWPWNQLLRSPSRDKEICKLIHGFSEQDHDDNNYIQVEFEVDDTGRGIPKERWKSVFENFVQIESSGPRNYDGTGLGLGIVRSLVRLMGGDIGIIDKDEPGEPGTRFRFNLIFKCSKQKCKYDPKKGQRQDILLQDRVALQATFGVNSTSASSGWQMNPIETPVLSQGLEESGFISPPIIEGVHVLLAMQGQGGKKVVKKWMERRGLQVWMIGSWEEFAPTVERIKQEIFSERFSTSERFDLISPESHIYDSWVDDLDTNILGSTRTSTNASLHQMLTSDGGSTVHSESAQKLNVHEARAHLLVIVDITMVKVLLETLCSDLEDILLEDDRSASYRVVWLVNANTPSADIQYLRSRTSVCNLILHKPLYASRLHRIWVLLQGLVGNKVQEESDGEAPHISPGQHGEKVDLVTANSLYTSLSCMSTFQEMTTLQSKPMTQTNLKAQSSLPTGITSSAPSKLQAGQEVDHARTAEASRYLPSARVELPLLTPTDQAQLCRSSENWSLSRKRSRVDGPRDSQHVLSAMHILVAEDNPILQRLTKTQLVRHGAIVECVDNGAEAARLVLENLYKSKVSSPQENEVVYRSAPQGAIKLKSSQPYDLVLMDCEMPILNGYEATQRIRGEESRYGIRTPVIALTAHAMAQDEKKCIEAGMDFYLTKPLAMDALVKVVTEIMGGRNLGNT